MKKPQTPSSQALQEHLALLEKKYHPYRFMALLNTIVFGPIIYLVLSIPEIASALYLKKEILLICLLSIVIGYPILIETSRYKSLKSLKSKRTL